VLVPNRREFLAISLASSALPLIAGERAGERSEGSPNLENRNAEPVVRSSAAIVEMTSPLALAFRAEAVKLGLPAHGIHDDITDLWYHHLDRQWSTAPATVAGITLSTSLFCLETFARDYGMRVWFRAIHKNRPDGGWAAAFAKFATAVPLGEPDKFQEKLVETAALPSEEPGPMVSWIIGPRLRTRSGPIS
jgi:hypothetical protein